MKNKFLKLVNLPVMKFDNVTRYSGLFQLNPELLSTHIVDVSVMSVVISRKLITIGNQVNMGILLERCIFHDMDEVLVGDIPRLTKYSSKDCYDILSIVSKSVASGMSREIDNTDYLYNVWLNAKDYTLEGYILKLSDMLSVAKKLINEVEVLGNNSFLRVALELRNYVNDLYESTPENLLNDEGYTYISSILNDGLSVIDEMIKKNYHLINKLGIKNGVIDPIIESRCKGDD